MERAVKRCGRTQIRRCACLNKIHLAVRDWLSPYCLTMGDVMTREQRSRCMSRIRGTDTKPERVLRVALWREGLRYRLRMSLPGKPDLVFRGVRITIFVDGCFWHRCPEHATSPKANASFWQQKIAGNVERDARVNRDLNAAGWLVLRFWEHEVERDLDRVVRRIKAAISGRTARSTGAAGRLPARRRRSPPERTGQR